MKDVNSAAINAYFVNFREVFLLLADRIKSAKTDAARQTLISEIVELNGLYGIQIMLDVELPADLEEIAYDFDHDEFPGYEQRLDNILHDKYLLMGGSGEASAWRLNP